MAQSLDSTSSARIILLVEDNPGDIRLIEEATKGENVPLNFQVARDGEQAMRFLRSKDPLAPVDLILLDLKLPKKSGLKVLAEIKKDPTLRRIPVVVLTMSGDQEDVIAAYSQHANAFITKPTELEPFLETVRRIMRFWFGAASLPPRVH